MRGFNKKKGMDSKRKLATNLNRHAEVPLLIHYILYIFNPILEILV